MKNNRMREEKVKNRCFSGYISHIRDESFRYVKSVTYIKVSTRMCDGID